MIEDYTKYINRIYSSLLFIQPNFYEKCNELCNTAHWNLSWGGGGGDIYVSNFVSHIHNCYQTDQYKTEDSKQID